MIVTSCNMPHKFNQNMKQNFSMTEIILDHMLLLAINKLKSRSDAIKNKIALES